MAAFTINGTHTHAGGTDITYTPTEAGTVWFELWGAGGGGALKGGGATSGNIMWGRGGGGGYVEGILSVASGDNVRLVVGNGGALAGTTFGGAGGAPGGGTGGRAATNVCGGGGGGYTALYLNGTLVAVAAGGGGAGAVGVSGVTDAVQMWGGGTGGGLNGGQGWVATTQTGGGGGSQTAPGSGQGNGEGSLAGGHGYPAGGTNATINAVAGGGGGGGYFGGGGGVGATASLPSGGGGSSFIHPTLVRQGRTVAASWGTPAFCGRRIDLAGFGGECTQNNTVAANNDGRTGCGFLAFSPKNDSASIPNAPTALTDISFTGRRVTYRAPADGTVSVQAWGSGGGGSYRAFGTGTMTTGGGAGAMAGDFKVLKGDLISFEIGQGGRSGRFNAHGGAGGWPDGGFGGRSEYLATAPNIGNLCSYGGGGGSTRVYLNGHIIAAAGAGAGTASTSAAGVGGGATGGAGGGVGGGAGGTQTTGAGRLQGGDSPTDWVTAQWSGSPAWATGGGGAGGWFGGQPGNNSGNVAAGGAGGSSYIGALINSPQTASGVGSSPATLSGISTPANVGGGAGAWGAGGWEYQGQNQPAPGLNGWGRILFTANNAPLTDYTRVFHATGADQTFTALSPGIATVRAYGAGGASAFSGNGTGVQRGGAGGYVECKIVMAKNDVLTLKVGTGGRKARLGDGGQGGWPDGGQGGRFGNGNEAGGGGGSTQILLNGVLVAVAPGGGGSTCWRAGGGGGGLSGSAGLGNAAGGGGTQSAGGNSGLPTAHTAGAARLGGAGYNVDAVTIDNNAGAGGGGGYFGGGGGYSNNGDAPGGGGGSNYINAALTMSGGSVSYAAGATNGLSDPTPSIWRLGVGYGGYGGGNPTFNRADQYDGYDGMVALFYDNAVVAPADLSTTGAIHTTAPTGAAGVPANATANFNAATKYIQVINNLTGQGIVEVTMVIPVTETDIVLEPPTGQAGISWSQTSPLPGPITLTATPIGKATVATLQVASIQVIAVTPPTAFAENGPAIYTADLTPITVNPVTAGGGGNGAASGGLIIANALITLTRPSGRAEAGPDISPIAFPKTIDLTAPNASAVEHRWDIGTITVTPPDAAGGVTYYGVQQPFANDIVVRLADLTGAGGTDVGHGNGSANPPPNYPFLPGEYTRVPLVPPQAAALGSVTAGGNIGNTDSVGNYGSFVFMMAPQAFKEDVATGVGAIPAIVVSPIQGFKETLIEASVQPFPTIQMVAPNGHLEPAVEPPTLPFTTILMTAPNGIKEDVVEVNVLAFPPIRLTVPVAGPEPVIDAGVLPFLSVVLSAPNGFKEDVVAPTLLPFSTPITLHAPNGVGGAAGGAKADFSSTVYLTNTITTDIALGYTVENPLPLPPIQMFVPEGITKFNVRIYVSIIPAKIVVSPVRGIGSLGIVAIGDMDPLVITLTEPFIEIGATANLDSVIQVSPVDAYTDEQPPPGYSLIKLKRSQAEGVKPALLQDREIAVNEADGVLFSRDGQGHVQATPYLGFGEGRFLPDGGIDGQVLGVDGQWRAPDPVATDAVIPSPPTGSRILLANSGSSYAVAMPAVGQPAGKVVALYKPFFLPRRTHLTGLSVLQWTTNFAGGSTATAFDLHLGVCGWEVETGLPGASFAYATAPVSGDPGEKALTVDATLEAGWYAAILGLGAEVDAGFIGVPGGYFLGEDFKPRGNPISLHDASGFTLATPPRPTGFLAATGANLTGNPDLAFVQGITA